MSKLAWTPWHRVVNVRDDIRTGELSLAVFAADLYDVLMGTARPVYQNPKEFFALTYPTFNLRELAKDVVGRLAGKNDKGIRQLELTYGGGKTHTLIALYHLVTNPDHLPDLPAVKQFVEHIGFKPPKSRIAALPFDKLDVEKGMEVRDPDGRRRWLKNPWSVLAFQIAGAEGLRLLNAEGKDAERDSAPAENLLTDLLAMPARQGLSTLILIDEVLMYAREKIGHEPEWRSRLTNFFQYLTQAVTKVDRAAIVASLLATDPRKSDELGREITQELYMIFRRESEEGVQPVGKDDVAEVLRRRFFTADSIRDRESFRPHVVAALKGVADLDEDAKRERQAAEERFLASYPFNPSLTDVFYSKWTQLQGFQKTRGVLRTFAVAIREAEPWDESPLLGPNIFLNAPDDTGMTEALLDLARTAGTEDFEGKKQEWSGIIEGELQKAREIEAESTGLGFREIEQAVVATFLHSQPIGQKATTRELYDLVGPTRPDKIGLEKALRRWTEISWFLDEEAIHEAEKRDGTGTSLPKTWKLGARPNLRQMHDDARKMVPGNVIEARLEEEISRLKSLSSGASTSGARVHTLPERPRDVEDDGEFHYAILGPKAASESGKPSAEARRFIDETTGVDRPRVNRNALVLVVPARDGLEAVRNAIRDYIGWEQVREQLKGTELDPIRTAMLSTYADSARKKIPDALQQAYCVVVTVSDKNEVQAFRLMVGSDPLFTTIKNDPRSRIQEQAVSCEALLPGGPYDLWRAGEVSRRVKDLIGAFASNPKLPKMLNRTAISETLFDGCRQGRIVLQLVRPDKTVRTWWRDVPEEAISKDSSLEVVLPATAELTELSPVALLPGALPGLWKGSQITYSDLVSYFAGGRVEKVQVSMYEEPLAIPKATPEAIETAVRTAVRDGRLWLTSGPASIFGEDIPTGVLMPEASIQAPPEPISARSLLPEAFPDAWRDGRTTALALSAALSQRAGLTLPWLTVREAIDGGFRGRLFERSIDSGPWPTDLAGSGTVKIELLSPDAAIPIPQPTARRPGVLTARAMLRPDQIQDLADKVGDITKAAAGTKLEYRIELELEGPSSEEVAKKLNGILKAISPDLGLE